MKKKQLLDKTNRRKKNNIKNERNIKPKIINLSSHKLNKERINLLRVGLKFFPIPKINIKELKKNSKNLKENLD